MAILKQHQNGVGRTSVSALITGRPHRSNLLRVIPACLAVVAVGLCMIACSSRPAPPARPAPIVRDIPPILRGTIGAEVSVRGAEPQLVSGLGVVVGLNGTGGDPPPEPILSHMERELARGGIGRGRESAGTSIGAISPRAFLRDPSVAVVIVEAAIPPGAPQGQTFDVRVRTLPGSAVSSLEGGVLWTTELRLGPASVFGGVRTRILAEARGPVYINPFSEAEAGGPAATRSVSQRVGRVLGGGYVTSPLQMALVLDNPSHTRARSITHAINSRFPEGPGDPGPTATGKDEEILAIRVPRRYRDDPEGFMRVLMHTRIDQSAPEEWTRRYLNTLEDEPFLAPELSACLEAIGPRAVQQLAAYYESPDLATRLAVVEAGARLGDPRVITTLSKLARTSRGTIQTQAIDLLAGMPTNPRVDIELRELAAVPDLEVRVAAYEAMIKRRDPFVRRLPVGPRAGPISFILDVVPAGEELVYVTQQGEPRLVLFGARPVELETPLLVTAWSNRFMLSAEEPTSDIRLYYRDIRTGRTAQRTVNRDVVELIRYLAQKPTPEDPEPGLGLTFSEVVGALYEMQKQYAFAAGFATERDKLLADLLRASERTALEDRPESDDRPADADGVGRPVTFSPGDAESLQPAQPERFRPRVVPLGDSNQPTNQRQRR